MAIEQDETKVTGVNTLMPWDKARFLEIRAIHAADGVEFTPDQFKAEFYDTRKCKEASTRLPVIKSLPEREAKVFLKARLEAVTKGELLTLEDFKADRLPLEIKTLDLEKE